VVPGKIIGFYTVSAVSLDSTDSSTQTNQIVELWVYYAIDCDCSDSKPTEIIQQMLEPRKIERSVK